MDYYTIDGYVAGSVIPANLRVSMQTIQPKSVAALGGSGLPGEEHPVLPIMTPMMLNEFTGKYQVWSSKASQVNRITAHATVPATDGTFTITVDGVTTGNIDHDASITAIKTALVNAGIGAAADITVTETGGGLDTGAGYVTISFGGALANRVIAVTATMGGLTGNVHVLSTIQTGITNNGIGGFIWPDPVTLDWEKPALTQMGLAGQIHYGDVAIPTGETADTVKAGLRDILTRRNGFTITGLDAVN